MGNIWCIGQQYNWLISNVTVAKSQDGQIWTSVSHPFDRYISASSICSHNGSIVAFGSNGEVSYTSDYSTWLHGDIEANGFTVTGSISTNKLVACGRRHYIKDQDGYTEKTETAQIFDSITGEPNTYAMIYSQGNTPSGFNNIRYFPNADIGNNSLAPICVAVGDMFGQPFAVYSTDFGETFTEISVPTNLYGSFFDVEYEPSSKKWYFGTNGTIAIADNLLNPTWTETQIFDADGRAITKVKINPEGEIIALDYENIWYSANRQNWISFKSLGYQWRTVEWYDSKWVVGAESALTQWTFWTSSDGENWTADNNQIYMSSLTIEP